MIREYKCDICEFELWKPVIVLENSHVGLYNDARFPGRLIVALNEHYENFEDLDSHIMNNYMRDIQLASRAIKFAIKSKRVNIAILGNAEPHIHAHLIPRFPDTEEKPNNSPWDDPRPRQKLDDKTTSDIVYHLRQFFASLDHSN